MYANSELMLLPPETNGLKLFKDTASSWFVLLNGCTKAAIKTPTIAKFLFSFLVLPKDDPVHVAFNKFLLLNSITQSPLSFASEIIRDLPEPFFEGVQNVLESIANVGIEQCEVYWASILLMLNNVLKSITEETSYDYIEKTASVFWPMVKNIIVLLHSGKERYDESFLFSVTINLFDFVCTFATKSQFVFGSLILNEKIMCKKCSDPKCILDFYYPHVDKVCKCGHKYLAHYKYQRKKSYEKSFPLIPNAMLLLI